MVAELNSWFCGIETARSFAAQVSRRVQRHGESIEDYVAALKCVDDKAIATATGRPETEISCADFFTMSSTWSILCRRETAMSNRKGSRRIT